MAWAGSWIKRIDQQKAYENSVKMDEGAAEAQNHMQPCRAPKTISVHYMVHKIKHHKDEAYE